MLDNLRKSLAPVTSALGGFFAGVWPNPTGWTFVGFAVSVAAAWGFSIPGYAGQLLGGSLVLTSGFFDIVDGSVARKVGRVTKRGSFLDSTLDRLSEVVVFGGIMLGGRAGDLSVLAALSLSLLVSYTRAKGDALGISLSGVGVGERSERLLVLSLAAILGSTGYGVILVAILAGLTFLERAIRAARLLQ